MIATDTVAMNFIMYMHEIDIWCKMKNGSRDGEKWNMAAGDAKWKWQLMVQKMRKKSEDAKWRWTANDESKEMIIDINSAFSKSDFVVKNLSHI